MNMKKYTIIEFSDGVQMVPTVWLSSDNKSCLWPKSSNQIQINKLIAASQMPKCDTDEDCMSHKVVRVFGSSDSYEHGMAKLRLAIEFSDIGTGASSGEENTAIKKSRHCRRPQKLRSSDSEEESVIDNTKHSKMKPRVLSNKPYPEVPDHFSKNKMVVTANDIALKDKTFTPKSHSSIHTDSKYLAKDGVLQSTSLSAQIKQEIQRKPTFNKIRKTIQKRIPETNNNVAENLVSINCSDDDLTDISTHAVSTISLSSDPQFKNDLFRKLNTIIYKLNIIDGRVSVLEQNHIRPNDDPDKVDSDDLDVPLANIGSLKNFEAELLNTEFFQKVVNALRVIGGTEVPSIVSKTLSALLCNSVAERFSLLGQKGKQAFKPLKLFALIKKSVRLAKPSATDSAINEAVGNWLAQAKARGQREVKKLQTAQRRHMVEEISGPEDN